MDQESNGNTFQKDFRKGKPFKKNKFGNPFGKKPANRFMSNAKGFAKKGNFGRGTHIEQDQFSYHIGILDALQKETQSTDERVAMANNVLEQTKEQEINLSSNQIVCKTLEQLIGFSDPEHLERFFAVFGENFRPICSDPYASHVLQKMVEIAFIRALAENKIENEAEEDNEGVLAKRSKIDSINELKYNLSTDFTDEHRTKCAEFVQRVSKFLLNNLEDYVWDACGSHLIRACIMSLSGVHIPKPPFSKGRSHEMVSDSKVGDHRGAQQTKKTMFQVPSEWIELMREFPSRLEMWPQFSELPYKEQSSGMLAVICLAFSHIDKSALKHFGKKLLNQAFINVDVPDNDRRSIASFKPENNDEEEDKQSESKEEVAKNGDGEDDTPSVFKSESSMYVLEALLAIAGPKLFLEIYNTLFAGRVLELALNRRTNFAVQKLIRYIKDKTVFETIFDDLIDHLDNLLERGMTCVVSGLSASCLRLNAKQAAFITAVQTTLHCTTALGAERPKALFACMLKMKPFEVLAQDKANYVVLYGSLIIQDILQFNKPIFLVNCILETPPQDLVAALQLPNGSHIADVFLKSKFIGEKSREKFIKLFEGFYMDLALGRCGSRALEKMFEAATEAQKTRIGKELSQKENKMNGTTFGRIIYNVLRLKTFKLSADQWLASWKAKPNKAEDVLTSIVKEKKRSV